MTVVKLSGGDMGGETMTVRCDLTREEAPVQIDYRNGPGSDWQDTQYQCAHCRQLGGLIAIGKKLAAAACEMPADNFLCFASVIADAETASA